MIFSCFCLISNAKVNKSYHGTEINISEQFDGESFFSELKFLGISDTLENKELSEKEINNYLSIVLGKSFPDGTDDYITREMLVHKLMEGEYQDDFDIKCIKNLKDFGLISPAFRRDYAIFIQKYGYDAEYAHSSDIVDTDTLEEYLYYLRYNIYKNAGYSVKKDVVVEHFLKSGVENIHLSDSFVITVSKNEGFFHTGTDISVGTKVEYILKGDTVYAIKGLGNSATGLSSSFLKAITGP